MGDNLAAPPLPAPLTVARLQTLIGLLESFPVASRERGKRYAAAGHVGDVDFAGKTVTAEVYGTRTYSTRWRWAGSTWTPTCSCPVSPECKHAYALACVILVEALSFEHLLELTSADLLPAELVRERLAHSGIAPERPHATGPRRPIPSDPRVTGERPSMIDASRSPRAPTPRDAPDARALARLRSSGDPWGRMSALDELLWPMPALSGSAYGPPYNEIVLEADPDLRCWLLAQTIAADSAGWVPEVLEPYLERDDLERRYREHAERSLVARVATWIGEPDRHSERSLRLEFGLHDAGMRSAVVLMEARLTTRRSHDEPRSGVQLRQLLAEARRTPGALPADQVELLELLEDPAVAAAIPESTGPVPLSGTALVRVLIGVNGSPLATWNAGMSPALVERAGIVPGGVVSFSPGTVRIEPSMNLTSGGRRVELRYLFEDGRELGEHQLVALRPRPGGARKGPTLVVADGMFWLATGGPPLAIADLFAYTGGFELPVRGRHEIVESLARAFPRFRAAIAPFTRVHSVQLKVAVDLRDDDWIQVRAFAVGATDWRPGRSIPADAAIFEYGTDGRWLRPAARERGAEHGSTKQAGMTPIVVGSAPDAALPADATRESPPDAGTADEVWLDMPDPDRCEPLARWIQVAGATGAERRGPRRDQPQATERELGWWLKLGPRMIERFAGAWAERPTSVEWYGNAAARRLLAAPLRVGPKLRVASSGMDWFTVTAEWQAEGLRLTDVELARLRSSSATFVKLPSGWTQKGQAEVLADAAESLAELGIEAGADEQRVSLWQLAHARPEALAAFEEFADSDAARRAIHELRERVAAFSGLPRVEVPRGVEGELRPYQREGLDFLAYTASLGLGAVLADDMGLGKTLQALAWLLWLGTRQLKAGPSLVVCPASVLHNWEREAQRFTPGMRVLILAGEGRHALRREISRHDLIVTNYALLRRDLDQLSKVEWSAVILDEAQFVKNPDAAVSRAARALRARHRLALTGTPLENRALDLWSIMAFVNPGYLGARASFVRRFDRADAPPHARRLLAAKLRPVMLRRLKKDVAPELPPRIEERRDCEMTTGQRKLYLAELEVARNVMTQLSARGGLERNRISILAVLTRLRQFCCHPALAGGRLDVGSGKFEALFELLEPLLAERHKVLVFSQFVECLKLIAPALRERGIPYHVLTGQTTKRAEVVSAFENDPEPCVFLISLRAGGTGLNLTAANYVVLFDPWWNPAVEAQAIDRTHRIGQDRTVIAYRMLTAGTIEERIWDLQQRKAALARDVLGEDGFAKSITREDLEYLLAEV